MNKHIEIIGQIEALLGELKTSLGAKPPKNINEPSKVKPVVNFSGLAGEIYNLIQEGFFKEPKAISEIQNKLRLEGIKKPTTSLMSPLLLLIRKKALIRSKPAEGKGPFRYHQR
ncbi:MAG: hypothetical protein ABSC89_10745 [Verrucomicrobiota bacterium]|jgi:hypothetical protein